MTSHIAFYAALGVRSKHIQSRAITTSESESNYQLNSQSTTMSFTKPLQILTISTALFTSGGIAALSAFTIPQLCSQPASRSLPLLHWLFSRGSHAAPTGILLSSTGFAYLAYAAVPGSATTLSSTLTQLTRGKPGLFLAASLLCFFTAIFTSLVMLPTNFRLIELDESLGGAHSASSARYREGINAAPRSAEDSVNGKEDVSQWTDGSGPLGKTGGDSSREVDEEVWSLLGRFGRLNYVRAGLMGVGGVVGLVASL